MTPPDADAGNYRLGQRLGAGTTGDIYEATHPSMPGRLAVKVLRPGLAQVPEAVKTYLAEVALVASLKHPGLVQVVDSGVLPQDGRPYVVMERLDGRPLESRLAAGGPMPATEVAAIVRGLAGALQAAHDRGVIHRELQPGNVFLSAMDDGAELPKNLNFGLARLRNASSGDAGVGAEEGPLHGARAGDGPQRGD